MSNSPATKTNTKAIVAIISVWFIAVVGLIFGYLALREIKTTGESGKNMATWAIIVGWALIALGIIFGIITAITLSVAVDQYSSSL